MKVNGSDLTLIKRGGVNKENYDLGRMNRLEYGTGVNMGNPLLTMKLYFNNADRELVLECLTVE